MVSCLIYGADYQSVDMLMFNGFFCAVLGAISVLLKLKIEKGAEDKSGDIVLPAIALSNLAYAALVTFWPMPLPHIANDQTFMSLFFKEVFATILVIFSTGPIKVYLDVKRGKTSVGELKANYED